MTSNKGGASYEVTDGDLQVAENVIVLIRRSRLTQSKLGTAVGISPQTMSRRLAGIQPWALWEVQAIARFFKVTLEEITGELPARDARPWVDLVRHQGLEPRTRCFGGNRPDLRLVVG